MFLVSATLDFDQLNREALLGASIDVPRNGVAWNARALTIEGWAVGRDAPVEHVEVTAGDEVLCRATTVHSRPDVAAHLPGEPSAAHSGFRAVVDATPLVSQRLVVEAVLASGARAHIGAAQLHHSWLSSNHPSEKDIVSVIIPCFNQAAFLPDAIESALNQTYPYVEVVVVDDGSTDNSAEVVGRYPNVRCVRQENAGLAAARNTGVRRSNGEFLVFLDSDDRLRPGAIAVGVQALRDRPACAFVSGEHAVITVSGEVSAEWNRPAVTADHYLAFLKENYVACPAAVLYRRAALHVCGGFDARYGPCEDYEHYLRISRTYPVCAHDAIVAEYRKYSGGMSDSPGPMLRAVVRTLKAQRPFARHDARRRQAAAEGVRLWRRRLAPHTASARARLAHLLTALRART